MSAVTRPDATPLLRAKVWLIGESNPYQSEPAPEWDLFPSPPQSAGARLCRILGYEPDTEYLSTFKRRNLLYSQKWSVIAARTAASQIVREAAEGDAFVLLGAKVAAAFRLDFEPLAKHTVSDPFNLFKHTALVIPHPSGLSRGWVPGMREKVREAVAELVRKRTV